MLGIDDFANELLEEAKRFYERAGQAGDDAARTPNLHAALMLGFCALEAHVNAIGDDFCTRPDVSVHEKGVLLEREVRLEDGEFRLKQNLKMVRLEDRIQFLHFRFSGKPLDRSEAWWAQLGAAMDLRNQLTHPKGIPAITERAVGSALQAILDTLEALYPAIYRRRFPPGNRGLQSRLTF